MAEMKIDLKFPKLGKEKFYEILLKEILVNMSYCRICGTVYYARNAGICNACHNEIEPFENIFKNGETENEYKL